MDEREQRHFERKDKGLFLRIGFRFPIRATIAYQPVSLVYDPYEPSLLYTMADTTSTLKVRMTFD